MERLMESQTGIASLISHDVPVKLFQYPDVSLSDVCFDTQKKQLSVVASFNQPTHLHKCTEQGRKTWWENSRQLQVDSLICLLDSDGNALFCSVSTSPASQSQEPGLSEERGKVQTLWSNPSKAFVTLRLVDTDNPALVGVLGRDFQSTNVRYVLVEFPGVLLPSFQPTLEALQNMSRDPEVPFADVLLRDTTARTRQIVWPLYANQPGFYFDLGPITTLGEPLRLSRNGEFDVSTLKARTTLDGAQCSALVGALSRDLALIQGPPGTGKSFVAIQVVKILLECRIRAQLNPIVCV